MLEPTILEIGGERFQIAGMQVLQAARLDKRVLALVAPLLGPVLELMPKDGKVDPKSLFNSVTRMDSGVLTRALSEALLSLDDVSFVGIVKELLFRVTWLRSGATDVALITDAIINEVFQGRLLLMYELLVAVMRFNKFTLFAMADIGDGLAKTSGSQEPVAAQPKMGIASAPSGN